jgi:hypothetical protein
LGISIEGNSSEDLGVLIEEAINKPRARLTTSMIDPNALSKHFEEGRFTDCTIRVKITETSAGAPSGRPAKRPRTGRAKAAEAEGPADGEHGVPVIKAHAVILASRSAYFERAMGGEWRESKDRSFEVEVADETGEFRLSARAFSDSPRHCSQTCSSLRFMFLKVMVSVLLKHNLFS